MDADQSGGPAALNGSEVDVVGKFLAVECFLVGLHDVGYLPPQSSIGCS
jgi:hypothetical protein